MKNILFILFILFSPVLSAKECVFSWTASKSENVVGYNIYKDGKIIKSRNQGTEYTAECEPGVYTVTAINKYDIESDHSESVSIAKPLTPGKFIINLMISIDLSK